jgi:hypothetical protein
MILGRISIEQKTTYLGCSPPQDGLRLRSGVAVGTLEKCAKKNKRIVRLEEMLQEVHNCVANVSRKHEEMACIRLALECECECPTTHQTIADSLITHGDRWTPGAMGYEGL